MASSPGSTRYPNDPGKLVNPLDIGFVQRLGIDRSTSAEAERDTGPRAGEEMMDRYQPEQDLPSDETRRPKPPHPGLGL